MISLFPSSTSVSVASLQVHPLYVTVVMISPGTLIGSFEKVFESLSCFVVIHFAEGEVLRILFARVFVMRLTTLTESILALAWTFSNLF